MVRRPLLAILVLATLPLFADDVLIAREGKGYLEAIDGQLVVHLKGTHYEMGFQHGKLLADRVKEDIKAYLVDFAYADKHTREELLGLYAKAQPFLPKGYEEEMKGMSDATGIPLEDIQAVHILPEMYHCSGAAVMNGATKDGKLYHYRSLDYSLDIGKDKQVQENATLLVFEPDGENAYVVVGWAGVLGCVTGMNAKGISVGEMGSSSKDESFEGIPMIFLLREVMAHATSLDEAVDIFRKGPRTSGYNFIVTDGKIPDARALEVTRSQIAVFAPNDPAENVKPHWAIPDAVRRVNHFVSPELAATQRKEYNPLVSESASFLGYNVISKFLEANRGKFDGDMMIKLCRQYPPNHPCLHQAVFCTSDLRFWVANAKSPKAGKFAGAQNQTFYPYNLGDLLAKDPTTLVSAKVGEVPSSAPEEIASPPQEGTCKSRRLVYRDDDSEEMLKLLETYDPASEEFAWKLEKKADLIAVTHHHLTFPSAVVTETPENNTVHAEYYQPRGDSKHPALVILHHLGGSMQAEEIIGGMLAADGIACLLVWMPYYEERAPKDGRHKEDIFSADLDSSRSVTRQAILDVRRAGDWLSSRPEVDGKQVGIMGISLGAIIGSMVEGIDLHFRKSALVLGGGDLAEIVFHDSNETEDAKKAFEAKGITIEKLREAWKGMDPITFAGRARKTDILMINGKRDEIIPRDCTERLNAAFGGPEIKWYPATHYSLVAYLPDVLLRIRRHVKGN